MDVTTLTVPSTTPGQHGVPVRTLGSVEAASFFVVHACVRKCVHVCVCVCAHAYVCARLIMISEPHRLACSSGKQSHSVHICTVGESRKL